MIHEIIFLLIGYKGNFFELNSDETSYHLLEDINIFNEGERARLNKLGQLSFNYCKIKEFSYSKESIGGGGGGFYLNGFKASLKDILTTYTNLVCELENEILLDYNIDGGQPSLSYIMSRLSDYFLLFSKLNELIQELETILNNENPNEAIGCELINWVYELYLKNVNTIKSNFELILGELIKIFFNQLADWLKNGKLFDPEFEFFLVPSNLEKSRELGYFNINSNNTKYEIIWERMPYFINENISNSLLFIGKAINILTNSREPLNLNFNDVLDYSKSCNINTSRLERTIYELRIESSKILYKKLFNIKSITNKDNEVNRNLTDYIEQFKNFYLLQYGEYYDNLLSNLHSFLSTRRSKFSEVQFEGFVRESDLNYLKIKSSEGTRAENSFLLDGLRFKLASTHDKNSTPSEAQKMSWNQLLPPNEIKLNYPIEYPLDLILESKDLELYNTLFNYLIWIRKLIYQLELFDIKKLSNEYKSKTLIHTRWLILHTVKAIWAYLQMDIIEPCYHDLMSTLLNHNNETSIPSPQSNTIINADQAPLMDFEAIKFSHQQYLNNLMKGCLLDNAPIASGIFQILQSCQNFANWLFIEERLNEDKWEQLDTIYTEYRSNINFIFRTLSAIYEAPIPTKNPIKTQHYFNQFLLRLDFNQWFTNFCYSN